MAEVITIPSWRRPCSGRLRPPPGRLLRLSDIAGEWHPSIGVEACGVFAVVWTTRAGTRWAPLHDFAPADQLRLIDQCRQTFVGIDDPMPRPRRAY